KSLNGAGLLDAGFGIFFASDERVGHFLKSIENRVSVPESQLFAECFSASIFADELTAVEERAGEIGCDVPGVGGAGSECRKFGADLAQKRREAELREEIGDGNADLGVGGAQSLFGLANVGATFEE